MMVGKSSINFKFILLSSALIFPFSVQAANFGPGGTTLTTNYTNAGESTIDSQGTLTVSGSNITFTNAAGATFNNATPAPGYMTTIQSGAKFNNSGTANLAGLTVGITGGVATYTNLSGGVTNVGATTVGIGSTYVNSAGSTTNGGALSTHSSTFTNAGTTTFSSLTAKGGNGNNNTNNTAGNFTITGASTINNSNFTNTANSSTGSATFGGNVNITDSSKFTNGAVANSYGSNLTAGNLSMNSTSKLYNYNGNMTLASLNMTGASTALNDAKGVLNVNGAVFLIDPSTKFENFGNAHFNSTLMTAYYSSLTNNANANLTIAGLTSVRGASTMTNSGEVKTGGLEILGGGVYNNQKGATTDASGGVSTIGTGVGAGVGGGVYNNYGTTNFADLTINTAGQLINNFGANLTAGDTTILGKNSRLDNTGTATLASLNASNTDVNNISIINNNTGGNLSVIGDTTLGFATLNNYGTMNLNTLTAKEFTVFGAYAGSITNISGVASLSGSDTDMFNNGKMSFGNNLLLNSGASITNSANGNMSVTGSSLFDQASFDNKGIADFAAFTAQNGSYYTVYSGATTNINGAGIFTGNTLMVNSGISNFNDTLVVSNGTRMNNGSIGKLNVIGTTIIDASTLTNNGAANLDDLYVQNGSKLNNTQNANLTSDGTTTIIGNGTTMVNAGTSNLNNLNIADNAKVTNNNILNATGTTIIDTATLDNSAKANLGDFYIQNNGSISNNSAGELNAASTYIYNNSVLNNTGMLDLTSLTTDASTFYNNSIATIGSSTVSNNSLFTNDTNGRLTISGDLKTSGSQILNKGIAFAVNGISDINTSTFDNYSEAEFVTVTLTDSTFNNYAGSTVSSGDFNLNSSNFNMISSSFNSAGKINIDSKSLFSVDSGLGYASTSTITTANGLDVYGTLAGSAKINGDVTVEKGGVINLLSTDILNITGNIKFKEGSTYYTTINVRDAHDITDTVSLINAGGAVFENSPTISIGSNMRPNELSKKYPILVASNTSVTAPTIDLRTSLLLNYNTFWKKTGTNEYTLYVQIDTNAIGNVSGLTYNENQLANAFGDLTLREDLPTELEDALNYVYTQVATEASLGRLLREYSLETSANYLNYMPTLNRMMTNGANARMTDLRNQDSNNDRDNNLWVTPFGAQSKQDHSKDIENQDIQGFDADVWGLTAGIDKQFSHGLLGAMISYGNINFKGDYTNDKIDSNGILLGIYGSTQLGNWFADSKVSYSHFWNESETTYNIPTTRTTKSDYGTDVYAFDVKGGYTFNMRNFNLSPSIGVDIAHARQEAFTEKGAGGLSRDVKSANLTSVELPIKLQLDWINTFDNGNKFKPKLYIEYAREVGDNMATLESNFVGSGGSLIKANSMYNDRDRYTVGTDISLEITPEIEFGLKYNADFRKNYTNNTFMLSGEYKF